LDRRLAGPKSRSGRGGEEKHSQPLSGLEPLIIQLIAQSYTTGKWNFEIFKQPLPPYDVGALVRVVRKYWQLAGLPSATLLKIWGQLVKKGPILSFTQLFPNYGALSPLGGARDFMLRSYNRIKLNLL
jgi:hypothetical protein